MGDKTRLFITGIAAAAVVGVTVSGHGLWSTLRDDGAVSAVMPLSALRDFDGITLSSSDDVIVTPGDHFAVSLEGDTDAAKYMNLYVKQGVLHVARRSHNGWFGSDNGDVTVHVTMPALARLWLEGSGDMKVEKFDGKQLRALIAGSGDLSVDNVVAEDVSVTVRGSGDVEMAGTTNVLTATLMGSGDMMLGELNAQQAELVVRGSGSIDAHASGSAKLDVTGSGEAHVSGTTQCQISKTGSGEAECTS